MRLFGATLVVLAVLLSGCGGPARAHQRVAVPAASPSRSGGSPSPVGSSLNGLPRFAPTPTPAPVTAPTGASAGWYSAIPTDQPVAFITIDDGWTKSPAALGLLTAAHVPVTLFLEINAIKSDVEYFRRLQQTGAVIEAHTITHQELKGKSYAVQKHEICGSADQLATWYGRRPVFFRPPFGDKDATTLRAVHDCGMKAAFFWKETTDKGIVRYQTSAHVVHRGDIILMHFRPAFADDFRAVLRAIAAAGLTPASLQDYVV
jgi:peptidoglycan/xylan/chitin deacetylase (PgdA/CDA1 family)